MIPTVQQLPLPGRKQKGSAVLKQLMAVLQRKKVSRQQLRQKMWSKRRAARRNSLPQRCRPERNKEQRRHQRNQKHRAMCPQKQSPSGWFRFHSRQLPSTQAVQDRKMAKGPRLSGSRCISGCRRLLLIPCHSQPCHRSLHPG